MRRREGEEGGVNIIGCSNEPQQSCMIDMPRARRLFRMNSSRS